MLLYTKVAPPKAAKKRSRAGCIHCKEKKKKCNEVRPQCDRCTERNLECAYEAIQPRKRRRVSFAGSPILQGNELSVFSKERWPGRSESAFSPRTPSTAGFSNWDIGSNFYYPESEASTLDWDTGAGFGLGVAEAPSIGLADEELVEEVQRTDEITSTAIVRSSRSQCPDLAMIVPSPAGSPLLEFCAPAFQEFTEQRNRRGLVDHFCNVLSHLIVFKEDTGNPFRQLVLPLSHGSSPILNAIFALSSAHLECRGIENEEKSLDFHNKALQGLAMLIEQNDQANCEEVLGAIMLLVYYEVLVQRGNSSIVNGHLKGAMAIMKSGPKVSTPVMQFLERAFRFYDVIAALSLGTAPNTASLASSDTSILRTPTSPVLSSPLDSVDTLLGLSTDLWPIIHRLSHLLPYKDLIAQAISSGQAGKAAVLRTELETTSQAIELALTNWEAPQTIDEHPGSPETENATCEDARMESIMNNAEAYRQSAFIYLYRTIRALPRSNAKVQQHAHLSLEACSNVVSLAEKCHDGPMSALLWPLFVAACEAQIEGDRKMAMEAFHGIEKRQGMNNISRAREVLEEVWRRGDEGAEEVDWREICKEGGISIVFG